MFARLKKWQILIGGDIESIDSFEKEMDSAMALQNLIEMERLGRMGSIPDRAPRPPNAHIITRDLEPDMKIPVPVTPENAKFPSHWKTFIDRMSGVVPDLRKILAGDETLKIFSERVLKRGHNLFSGGNVAQISCKMLENDVVRVQGRVYASMKSPCYTTFADLQKGDGVLQSACDCKNA
jgi:hypothetical protein